MKIKQVTILFTILLVIIMTLLVGCANPLLPVYKITDEEGMSVFIDGVRYKQQPELKWYVNPTGGEIIGYAGGQDTQVSVGLGDTERNFIFIKYQYCDYYSYMLYRTDKNIPDVSQDSVDRIVWVEQIKGTNTDKSSTNDIIDKETIDLLFNLIDQGEKIQDAIPIKNDSEWYEMNIRFYCSDLPGASYQIDIMMSNGKIVCGNPESKYVEIPMKLLRKIAGHEIDVEGFLS